MKKKPEGRKSRDTVPLNTLVQHVKRLQYLSKLGYYFYYSVAEPAPNQIV
jgi:hypothetical protein